MQYTSTCYQHGKYGLCTVTEILLVHPVLLHSQPHPFQLGVPHSYLMMSYQYKFQDEDQTKVKGSVKYVCLLTLPVASKDFSVSPLLYLEGALREYSYAKKKKHSND